MKIITEFEWVVEKERIFKVVGCQPKSPVYNNLSKMYDYFLKNIKDFIDPIGVYRFIDIPSNFEFPEMANCRKVVLCFLTLGEEVSLKTKEYFTKGEYLEALLLEVMVDEIIFEMSEQLYCKALLEAKENGWNLTGKIEPGSENVPLLIQKEIFEKLRLKKMGVSLSSGNMLMPLKSLTFFCGAGEAMTTVLKGHNCSNCSMEKCMFKDERQITATVLNQDKKSNLNCKKGLNLLSTLKEYNIDIQSSCMGNGTCGKCKIKVLEGKLKPTDTDLVHFSQKEIQDGLRLACCAYPLENCTIKIAAEKEKDFYILDSFRKSNGEIKSIVEQRNIEFENEELENNISLVQIINKKLGREYSYSLNSLVKLSRIINKCSAYSFNNNFYKLDKICLIIQDDYVLDIQMVNERHVYGIAVDLGTTTIVVSLVNLLNGEVIKSHSILNSQRKFGEDVISRIQYSACGNLDELKNVVREDILSALAELLNSTGVNPEKVFSMVIAGNTTMQSLLLGLHCESLVAHPFKTVTVSEHKIRFRDIFISNILECEVIVLSGISAYVGADIVSGMLYCNFDILNQNVMLIDIGTNGELVIGSKERILCLATAAGPAFEGGNITNGIGSVTGAIHEVKMINNEIRYNTINDSAPIGICGSGVLDIVSTGLLNNLIDKTGRFSQKIDRGVLEIAKNASNEAIIFTQKDIREVQLAKSAIRTGIEILIKRLNVSYDEIETVYIAGGFGTYMDIESAIRIGMIPKEFKGKIKIVGNSSLGGAITYLLNKKSREKINNILEKATYIDISSDRTFNDLFVENMFFLEN